MADYSPNFVNPSYATPEQLATQRAYAAELLKKSGEGATRPSGVIGNGLSALAAALERNRANEVQSESAGRNSSDLTSLIQALQSGKVDPAVAARIYANPMASPEHRALVGALITPQKTEDVMGRPGYQSPSGGVQPAPINSANGPFQPGIRAPESAGSVSTLTPIPAPMAPPQRPIVSPTPRVWGDKEAEAAGLYPSSNPAGVPSSAPPGVQPQAPVLPPSAAAAPNFNDRFGAAFGGSRIDQLAAKDRELSAAKALTQGGADANSSVIKADIAAANDAPNVLKGIGIIKDNIQRYGDKITFGPTSPWSLEMKRAAANYAPGVMRDQLNAIAAADSINKVGIGLAGTLASSLQGGSNADTFAKAMQGVPGLTTSKEGALAMADMIQQAALKQQELGKLLRDPANYSRYAELKANFFRDHPVINPLTGNPIEMDVEAVKRRGDGTGTPVGKARIISVEPALGKRSEAPTGDVMSDADPEPIRVGQQYAQASPIQMRPLGNGQVQVINIRTGQVLYTGSASGASNFQAGGGLAARRIIE